ncbi:RNA/RNP complex-1-interacting phosphatase [Varanus komodoensis]|nr:RNA/RNP complex-1-interacting phosphatase [Varanus komodoensis]
MLMDLPKSMEYKKLFTVGLEVPDDPTILQFKKWVRKFLWENAENDKLIGVHCTNGINRTGYLICRYLIDVEGWDPETAIQAFGEARGHHMDGNIYLTDLKTQPMRSNLGMNLWDADGDTVSPANDIDGHIDRLPNEEFSRPGKRLRVYDSDHSDFPEQIRLREFDFINKGPGHPRRPYHDHEFQDDLQPLISMRQRHFPSHPFYNGYQEEMQWKDLDFAPRTSGERLRPFQDRQLCEDIPESAPSEEIINMGRGQRQRNFPAILPHSDMLTDSQVNRGHGQRRRPFYDQKSNDEFQPHMQLKDLAYLNKRPVQQMRPFQDSPTHENMQPPMGDFEFVSRGHGQRMLDHPHHSESQRDMPLEDFDDRDSESRCRSFQDHQSYSDFNEQPELNDFLNRVPKQRIMAFNDHLTNDNVPHEGYLERGHPFLSCEHFPESSKVRKDYGSDNGYNINCSVPYKSDSTINTKETISTSPDNIISNQGPGLSGENLGHFSEQAVHMTTSLGVSVQQNTTSDKDSIYDIIHTEDAVPVALPLISTL